MVKFDIITSGTSGEQLKLKTKLVLLHDIDGAIADSQVEYLHNHYGQDIAVIFYGYPDGDIKSTKNSERVRQTDHSSPDVMFHEKTVLESALKKLISNGSNEKRFIELLKKTIQNVNICVQQVVEDADFIIVNNAISVAPQFNIEFLVLSTALALLRVNLYIQEDGRGNRQIDRQIFNHIIESYIF